MHAIAEVLRKSLDLKPDAVIVDYNGDPQPYPSSPAVLYVVHSIAGSNDSPAQDYWNFMLDFGVTVSMLMPHVPFDRPQLGLADSEVNPLRVLTIAAYKLQAMRWEILQRANESKPTNMGGLVEAPFVANLPVSVTKRSNDWWRSDDGGSGAPVGVSGVIRLTGARWLTDQGDALGPDPGGEADDILTTPGL